MKLSDKAIATFKEIYSRHFNVILADDVANDLGLWLLRFVKLIYKPIPRAHAKVLPEHLPMYEL